MKTTINNKLIRSLIPCYDPSKYVTDDNENLPVLEWVNKYRGIVPDKDIIWLLCHKEFLSDKDLRMFAVWCAREALKLVNNPDIRSIKACGAAELYANGKATREELRAAADAASTAADIATSSFAANAFAAAYFACTSSSSAYYAASSASRAAARVITSTDQLDKLLTYFNEPQ